jgi:hypothetical protein
VPHILVDTPVLIFAGCAMHKCPKHATHIGPAGVMDPPAPENAKILTCEEHADDDAVPLERAGAITLTPVMEY